MSIPSIEITCKPICIRTFCSRKVTNYKILTNSLELTLHKVSHVRFLNLLFNHQLTSYFFFAQASMRRKSNSEDSSYIQHILAKGRSCLSKQYLHCKICCQTSTFHINFGLLNIFKSHFFLYF